MPPTIRFYDGQYLGTPSQGQLVSFDSLVHGINGDSRYSVQIGLRADVNFMPEAVEQLDCFDLDLTQGVTEYDWSRTAQHIFAQPHTLHVGIGNTSALDHFIRYALYRCLSTLPNTQSPKGAHYLDLLTVSRAITLLRPSTMPFTLPVDWSEQHRRDYIQKVVGYGSRANAVFSFTKLLTDSNPKLMAHAITYSSPTQIANLCGLVDCQVESLASLRPVFMCHEQLSADGHWGIYLALATDPQYANMIYMVDLQCDLTELIEDAGSSVARFIRTDASQADRPIVRVNLNRIPFASPLGVIDKSTASRLSIDLSSIKRNAALLSDQYDICLSLMEVSGASETTLKGDPDYQLYGAEYLEPDCLLLLRLHSSPKAEWPALIRSAHDSRIIALGDRLIRRLEPTLLSESEAKQWHAHCASRLAGRANPSRMARATEYCSYITGSAAYPLGVSAAARHWLKTIEIGNERRKNV